MTIPAKQTGMGTEANLLYEILKKLDRSSASGSSSSPVATELTQLLVKTSLNSILTKIGDGTQKNQITDPNGSMLYPSGQPAKLITEITRPNDILPYLVGDMINVSTSVPVFTVFPQDAAISVGGGNLAMLIKAESTITTLAGCTLRIWFLNDTPSGMVGDNAPFINSYANATKRAFYQDMTFDALLPGSDTVISIQDITKEFVAATGLKTMGFVIQTLSAFTPIANGKITISLSVLKLS